MAGDETWKARGNCREVETAVMFPMDGAGEERSVRVCFACPVADECLAFARRNKIKHGTWGGLSESERGRRKRRRPAVPSEYQRCGGSGCLGRRMKRVDMVTYRCTRCNATKDVPWRSAG